jgi:hypothetical protein
LNKQIAPNNLTEEEIQTLVDFFSLLIEVDDEQKKISISKKCNDIITSKNTSGTGEV